MFPVVILWNAVLLPVYDVTTAATAAKALKKRLIFFGEICYFYSQKHGQTGPNVSFIRLRIKLPLT